MKGIKVAKTEFTIDFWYLLFSYIDNPIGFLSHDFIWDQHIKVTLYRLGTNKGVGVTCTPQYSLTNPNQILVSVSDEINPKLNVWTYMQCSVKLDSSSVYLNGVTTIIKVLSKSIDSNLKDTTLVIKPGDKANTNYGFLFLREMKLYSKFNVQDFNTKCLPSLLPQYLFYLPFLLHYFPNNNGNSLTTIDIVGNAVGNHLTSLDFIGYNVLDKTNSSLKLKNLYLNQCKII